MADHGPYETERQAAHGARAVVPLEDGRSILTDAQHRRLFESACEAARIEPGAFDRRILDWISGFDDSPCAVLAGLIRRAHESGRAAAMVGAETEWALSYIHRPNVPGLAARRVVERYPDEARARKAVSDVGEMRPEDEPKLMRRESSLWKEANETGENGDG